MPLAILFPNRPPRQRTRIFHHGETRRKVAFAFGFAHGCNRLQQPAQECFLRVARPDRPRGDPVDRSIEKVETDMNALHGSRMDAFFEDGTGLVVEGDNMVAIPTDSSADMEKKMGDIQKHGTDFVGDGLGRMKMPRIQTKADFPGGRIAHIELVRADGIAFHADPEEFGFHRIDVPLRGNLLGKNGVEGLHQTAARCVAVGGGILIAIWNPDICDGGIAEFFTDGGGDPATGDAVVHPKLADGGVGVRQGETVSRIRMAEAGRVEIDAPVFLLRPINPRRKIIGGQLVAFGLRIPVRYVTGVEIDTQGTRNQTSNEIQVFPKLFGGSGFAGVIPGRQATATRPGVCGFFESPHIISLPAMQGNGNLIEGTDGIFGLDTCCGKTLLGGLIKRRTHKDWLSAGEISKMTLLW